MTPNYLKVGDKVALIATAKRIDIGALDGAIREVESWGLKVIPGSNLYSAYNQFSGTDIQRRQDLQRAIDDPEIDAVIFARGGYGTARILDEIDWESFQKNPKWLCGFSDLTALHGHVFQNFQIETLHSMMPIFFKDGTPNAGSESLKKALFGYSHALKWNSHPLNRLGENSGPLVGGNLSVICSIIGSNSSIDYSDKILFLEDLCENLYHLDRMMIQLKRAEMLSKLKGLVVGQFTDMEDNEISFGKDANEIIFDAVSEYDFPVSFDAPIGHVKMNMSIRHGAIVRHSNLEQSIVSYE